MGPHTFRTSRPIPAPLPVPPPTVSIARIRTLITIPEDCRMPRRVIARIVPLLVGLVSPTLPAQSASPAPTPAAHAARGLVVPVDYRKLKNGLKVVLSRDTTTPTAAVAVYYNIGFRNEPRNRTGFAHLF